MEFELSYLKILKDNAVKSATFNMPENLENSAVVTGMEKVSFHSNPKERHAKGSSNYCTIVLISHASKVTLKIFQARLQQYLNFQMDVQVGCRKGRGTRDQIANIHWIIDKAREFQKNIYFCIIGASLVAQLAKNPPAMQDLSSIPGLGRSTVEGKDYPVQYSGLENSMDE